MAILSALVGAALVLTVLWEGFETIVLPRRVTRRFRFTRLFFRTTWRPWSTLVRHLVPEKHRETYLSYFGPISLLLLLSVWAGGLIVGFALLYRATGAVTGTASGEGILTDLYLSGTTFFTLGIGDVTPRTNLARMCTVAESGMGFGFLALIIGYLPALNQSFAQREVSISMLDSRAGSPPTAAEILRRHSHERGMEALRELLHDWEHWSAELLESHLSYPVLAYFRSQHENQSWLTALTSILDTCAFLMVSLEANCRRQAELTYAIARHSLVDLSLVFMMPPREPTHNRLPPEELSKLRTDLTATGLILRQGEDVDQELTELRRQYEPYANALALYLRITVPPWAIKTGHSDNWQANPWEKRGRAKAQPHLPAEEDDEHF
ncbi:MAG: two pore domain potassium channel family protein [Geobacter sp.]|nr:MAG: two pore domain potassium channel family protein [Geobacter sp.]